jgi:pimeloyl-ACP methyl ester carboxylesterase
VRTLTVETDLGPVQWTAQPEVFDNTGPLLLVIRGAFAGPKSFMKLPASVSVDCAIASLPGHSCPSVSGSSVGVLAMAFRQSIEKTFGARPTVVIGLSIGGLVSMALRLPQVRRLILVDPPLWTDVPAMTQRIRDRYRDLSPEMRDFCWQVFGVSDVELEPRSYAPLLSQLRTPADVFLGGRRELGEKLPGFNAPDAYADHPFVTRHVIAEAGHDIPMEAPLALFRVIEEACRTLRHA